MNEGLLVLGQVAGALSGDGWFTQEELANVFEDFRVPSAKNLGRSLGQLRASGFVINNKIGTRWSLTPFGRQRVEVAVGNLNYERIATELAAVPGAEFAHVRHAILPPSMAPPKWAAAIARLLNRSPFDTNVFLMTRFPFLVDGAVYVDPVADVMPVLREAVEQHGLTLHTASDRQIEDDVWGNVGGYIWACRYGMGLFETRGPKSNELNDNVLIELGSMLTIGRRCMILRDVAAPSPPTDLAGQIYKPVDLDDLAQVTTATHRWMADDLGLGTCPSCPVCQ